MLLSQRFRSIYTEQSNASTPQIPRRIDYKVPRVWRRRRKPSLLAGRAGHH